MNKSDPSQNDGTAKVIVLLPRDDDPVRQIASGDHPHTTLFYLGDGETDMEELKKLVKAAADLGYTYPDPFDMIAGEGTLGVEGAHVYFLDARFSEKVRSQIEVDPWLQKEMEKAEQFPTWTPHMTIGYPDAPAERVSERPDGIVYDRIAIFDQGDVIEYPFDFTETEDQEEPESVTASAEVEEDEELSAAVAELQEHEDDVAVPIKGILAPEGVPSSDNRMFSEGALTARELPIPLRWVEKDSGGHDNAVIVGRMDKIFREDGVIKFQGVMDTSASAYEAVRLIANGMLRGVSVDVSDVVAAEGDDEVTEFSSAKIAAATLVAIPAFSEAFVSLGYWDEDELEDEQEGEEFAISEKSWDGSASRFTEEEYHRSCLIHEHPDGEPSKSACKLPIREPNGDINKNGVHAAASRIDQADASEEEKSKAKSKLKSAYKEIGEEPPEQFADVQFADKLLPKHLDGPGWITHPKPTKRITSYWVDGRGAAKIRWGQGGDFNRCRRQLAKYVKNPDWLAGLCFTGDTEFTTADGVMTFADAVGTTQRVLTAPKPTGQKGGSQPKIGYWREAPIESFGEHEVMTVRLRRNRQVKEIRATRNHLWFGQTNPNNLGATPVKEIRTEDLKPGTVLSSLMPIPGIARGNSSPSPFGISAGMVFGDGTASGHSSGASIDLWGEKDANMLKFFSLQPQKDRKGPNDVDYTRVYGMPNSWKRPPALDEGYSYLYGWLAGYFAADGSVTSRGAASISSANREHLEYAAVVARKLGISVQPIGMTMRKGKGEEESALYKLGFVGDTLHEDFFLVPHHRENWLKAPHVKSAVRWKVEEVVETGEVEEVFCAVVPETENFVLTDTIWVHNCANMHHRALGIWPGQHSLESSVIASASPSVTFSPEKTEGKLPAEWFQDPDLDQPTPLTVTDDGRVFGHLASWQVCHIGFTDDCVIAPRSVTDYSYFRTGEVDTTEGPVAVGNIVMGGPHADPKAKMRAAFVHYASTSSALADVNVGEDEHGIWIAGALREGVGADDLRSLKASGLSGDWRHVRANGQANLELVAALAVNVQGFPIPRPSLAASGETKESLVAASPVVDSHKVMNRARISEARSTLRANRAAMLKTELGL